MRNKASSPTAASTPLRNGNRWWNKLVRRPARKITGGKRIERSIGVLRRPSEHPCVHDPAPELIGNVRVDSGQLCLVLRIGLYGNGSTWRPHSSQSEAGTCGRPWTSHAGTCRRSWTSGQWRLSRIHVLRNEGETTLDFSHDPERKLGREHGTVRRK